MIVLKNASFIDKDTHEFVETHVVISGEDKGSIAMVSRLPDNLSGAKIIDCTGKYVIKSLGCAHSHSYASLTNGMPTALFTSQNYYDNLKHFWWNLDTCLSKEIIEVGALVTAIEFAKRGTTFVIDHHSSPNITDGALELIASAFDKVGVGHLLCHEISDRNGVDIARKQLAATEEYLKSHQGLVGLHASFTLTDKTLKKAVDLASKYNTGIHVHVAEDLYDQDHCYDIHNLRVVERLNEFGVLDLPKSILVNCLYLTDNERRLIQQHQNFVVQNTESCLSNNESYFNSCLINENVMLGTDSIHFNMFRALKNSYYLGQHSESVNCAEAYSRLRKIDSYLNGNGVTGYGDDNFMVLDYKPMSRFDQNNFLEHMVSCIDTTNIQHVISNGQLIVKDREVLLVDEMDVKKEAQRQSEFLWKKMY